METLTLLERCQREAREEISLSIQDGTLSPEKVDEIIANTLKQAAEALEGMKYDYDRNLEGYNYYSDPTYAHNQALTDAQKILLGENNENV